MSIRFFWCQCIAGLYGATSQGFNDCAIFLTIRGQGCDTSQAMVFTRSYAMFLFLQQVRTTQQEGFGDYAIFVGLPMPTVEHHAALLLKFVELNSL